MTPDDPTLTEWPEPTRWMAVTPDQQRSGPGARRLRGKKHLDSREVLACVAAILSVAFAVVAWTRPDQMLAGAFQGVSSETAPTRLDQPADSSPTTVVPTSLSLVTEVTVPIREDLDHGSPTREQSPPPTTASRPTVAATVSSSSTTTTTAVPVTTAPPAPNTTATTATTQPPVPTLLPPAPDSSEGR